MTEQVFIAEIEIPPDAPASTLTAADIERYLATRVTRSSMLLGALSGIVLIGVVIGGMVLHDVTWMAVVGGALFALFGFGAVRLHRKATLARRISAEPTLVYWVQSATVNIPGDTLTFITLHTRGHGMFEVGLGREDIVAVALWLRQHNPAIRLGTKAAA